MTHTTDSELRFGPIGPHCIHLCVDMQNLFDQGTAWSTPWMHKVLPRVSRIAQSHPTETIFTRFMTLAGPDEGHGTWKRYYERWHSVTTRELAPGTLDLLPPLAELVPPAEVVDKIVYSPWLDSELDRRLEARKADTIVVTGGETDVCVLSTVLGSVDRGYRTIVVTDALCSSSDEAHDALMILYRNRYSQQVETVTTDLLLTEWT